MSHCFENQCHLTVEGSDFNSQVSYPIRTMCTRIKQGGPVFVNRVLWIMLILGFTDTRSDHN